MQNSSALAPGGVMHRFRNRYGLLLEWVVMFLVIALAVEVTLGIVFRMVGHSLVWYDEVASVLLAWLTFYGSALASVKRAHIGCPEVVDQFPPAVKRVVSILGQILVILFFALLGWVGLTIMPALAGGILSIGYTHVDAHEAAQTWINAVKLAKEKGAKIVSQLPVPRVGLDRLPVHLHHVVDEFLAFDIYR